MATRRKRPDAVRAVQGSPPHAQGDVRAVFGSPASPGASPLRIVATMRSAITSPPMLDGLLASVVAQKAGLVPGFGPMHLVEIPVAREPGGRFHLATSPMFDVEAHELRYVNQKFPIAEAQMFGDAKLRRVHVSQGATKSYRIPTEAMHVEGDKVAWYCVGDEEPIRELLRCVTHLGKKRGVGRGAVASWLVTPTDECVMVMEGRPTRPLPLDWPGVTRGRKRMHTLTYPYWEHGREEMLWLP